MKTCILYSNNFDRDIETSHINNLNKPSNALKTKSDFIQTHLTTSLSIL